MRIYFTVVITISIILYNCGWSFGCKSKKPRVLVVGAGAAGIAAASKLFENGFDDVTILEAEERVGGRIHTTRFADYSVDLGGEWVHGEKGNAVFDLAQPLGLLDWPSEPGLEIAHEYLGSLGRSLNKTIIKNVTEFFFKYAYESVSGNNAYKSTGEYVEKMFNEKFKDLQEIYDAKEMYLRYLEAATMSGLSADSWYHIQLSNDQFTSYGGDNLICWKNGGYSMILNILMKRYPNPEKELPVLNNTILNSEVTLIDYRSSPVKVTTARGQTYEADHVIVTVPLGVLKEKYDSLFNPPLPGYKVESIKGLGFGNVAKIYLLFHKPFWQLDGKRMIQFTFMWNRSEEKIIENDPEKSWLLGMIGAITVQHKPNLLQLWVGGKYVRIMELLPEEKVFHHLTENLHRFFDSKFNVTEPAAMLRTRWYSNPHFRGTFHFRSIESVKNNVTAKMLEEPVTPDNLAILFAGEATSTDRYSTVDGAIASGWNAAAKLIGCYKKY